CIRDQGKRGSSELRKHTGLDQTVLFIRSALRVCLCTQDRLRVSFPCGLEGLAMALDVMFVSGGLALSSLFLSRVFAVKKEAANPFRLFPSAVRRPGERLPCLAVDGLVTVAADFHALGVAAVLVPSA